MGDFTTSADEVVAIVDDNDKIIGEAKRRDVHTKGLLHRECFVYIINPKKQVLLQKRADSHKWDHSVGCHFAPEESYIEAAQRETEEEIGIKLSPGDFSKIGFDRFESSKPGRINRRFATTFLVRKDIPLEDLKIDRSALEEIKYFSRQQLKELMKRKDQITSPAVFVLDKYILKLL